MIINCRFCAMSDTPGVDQKEGLVDGDVVGEMWSDMT